MKNYAFILLLFLVSNIYSQDSSYIKALDTIFVKFKEDPFQVKTVFPLNDDGFQKRWYTITLGNNYDRKFIRFYFQEYINPEKREMKMKSDIKHIKKKKLKKYKNKIVEIDFFKNHNICTLKDLFYNKVVYIIDINEKKKKKCSLYEVSPSFSCDVNE